MSSCEAAITGAPDLAESQTLGFFVDDSMQICEVIAQQYESGVSIVGNCASAVDLSGRCPHAGAIVKIMVESGGKYFQAVRPDTPPVEIEKAVTSPIAYREFLLKWGLVNYL